MVNLIAWRVVHAGGDSYESWWSNKSNLSHWRSKSTNLGKLANC